MIFASLLAKLGFQTAEWTKGTEKAKNDLKSLDATTSDFLKGIKAKFGARSNLGMITKLFVGGGAIAGIAMAGKEIYELADAWMGTKKAEEAASDAVKDYNDYIRAIDEGQKTARGWELSMNERLVKSYRDLDDARHPENKGKNALANEIDSVTSEITKQKDAIADLNRELKESKDRADAAATAKAALDGEGKISKSHYLLGVGFVAAEKGLDYYNNNARRVELQKTIDAETALQREKSTIRNIAAKVLADDELKAVDVKNNLIATATKTADDKAAEEHKKLMEESQKQAQEDAKEKIALAKETAEAQLKAAKEAIESKKDDLEKQRDDLRDAMHHGSDKITTQSYRAGDTYHVENDPSVKIEEQQLGQLKILNAKIEKLTTDSRQLNQTGVAIPG